MTVYARIISDIMEVPLPRACSRRLMSFFTFHISIFFSASLACGALIMSEGGGYCLSGSRFCLAKVSCLESPEFLVSTLGIVLVSFLVLLKLQSGMSLRFCDEGWRSGLAGLKARGSFFDSLLPSQHFTLSLSLSLFPNPLQRLIHNHYKSFIHIQTIYNMYPWA